MMCGDGWMDGLVENTLFSFFLPSFSFSFFRPDRRASSVVGKERKKEKGQSW